MNNTYSVNANYANGTQLQNAIAAFEAAGYSVNKRTQSHAVINTEAKTVTWSNSGKGTYLGSMAEVMALLETGVQEAPAETPAEEVTPDVAPSGEGCYSLARSYVSQSNIEVWEAKLVAAGFEVSEISNANWIIIDSLNKKAYSNDERLGTRIMNEADLEAALSLEAPAEPVEEAPVEEEFFTEGEADLAEDLAETIVEDAGVAPININVTPVMPEVSKLEIAGPKFNVTVETTAGVNVKVTEEAVKVETK